MRVYGVVDIRDRVVGVVRGGVVLVGWGCEWICAGEKFRRSIGELE